MQQGRRDILGRAGRVLLAGAMLVGAAPSYPFHFPWDQGHDTTQSNDPAQPGPDDRPQTNPDENPLTCGSPAYAGTGHCYWTEQDFTLRGRSTIGVRRTYNSNDPTVGLFGNGWSSELDVALYPANKSGGLQRILRAVNGKRFVYEKQADGTFRAPASRYETIVEGPSNVTMTLLDGRRNVFALDGRLLERADANGNRVVFSYDGAGRPVRLADDNGRALTITYNGVSLVDSVTDHTGRSWRYGYDANANLVSVTDPAGGVRRYTWQAFRPSGDAHTYYQLLSVTDASGVSVIRYTYNTNRVATYTVGANTITYTRPASNTTLAGTVSRRDALNVTTSFTYGALGLITREVNGIGGATSYTFDNNGRMTSTADPLSRSWTSTYDSLGRQTSNTNPLGQANSTAYAGNDPRPVSVTSPSGRVVSMAYDSRGNLLTMTDPSGAVTRMAYSARGDVTTITNALGQATAMVYNAAGLPTSVTDALGRTSSMSYDALGRVVSATNAAGETTRYSYDALDRVTSVVDPLNQTTSFSYDAAGRLLSVTDAKGSVTRYEYDSFGRRSAEVAPDGRRTSYAYRADNLLSSITWPDNTSITYQYDANKRVTSESAGGETISYSYNAVNQLLSATGPGGTVSYTYDNAGRVLTETSNGRVNTITRNAEGERTRLDTLGQSQTYTRDARGLVTRIAAPAGSFDFAFDALGRRTQLAYPNGSTAGYAYDSAGQLTNLTHTGVFNAPYAHTFDAAGRITRISGDGPDWNYSYDALGRLTRATQGGDTYTYTLDQVGNILDGGRTHDVNHRLTADATKDYSYDPRGNLTQETERASGARTVYTWNVRNQLTRLEFFASAAATTPTRTLSFTYDPSGRRASKTDNGVIQRFVYDGDDLVGTLDGSNNVLASNVFSGLIDEPLASTSGGSAKLLYANHLGSVMAVADGVSLTHSYGYEPYGQTKAGSSPDSTQFRYTGREKDTDSLYFYRARYYSATTQRFASADPIGLEGGYGLYGYGDGDPIANADPYGDCPICVAALIGGLIGGGIDIGMQLIQNGGNFSCIDWSSVGISALAGAAGSALGGAGTLTRVAGKEWSHWIPARYFRPSSASYKPWLPQWLNGPLNGNYVSPMRHYMHDPFRYPSGWRNWGDKLSKPLQQLDRIPDWLKGGVGGGAAGSAATPGSDCNCGR